MCFAQNYSYLDTLFLRKKVLGISKLIFFSQVKAKLKLYNHQHDQQKQEKETSNLPLKKVCFNTLCMSV